MDNNVKQCSKCSKIKPLKDFPVDRRSRSGYKSKCLECHNEDQKKKRASATTTPVTIDVETGEIFETIRDTDLYKMMYAELSKMEGFTDIEEVLLERYCELAQETIKILNALRTMSPISDNGYADRTYSSLHRTLSVITPQLNQIAGQLNLTMEQRQKFKPEEVKVSKFDKFKRGDK